MGFFDRFSKSKKESPAAEPKVDASSCPHPALRQLAEIYDSRRVSYKIQNKDNSWSLIASLKTERNANKTILFECKNMSTNDISITHIFPVDIPKEKFEQILLLINKYNRKCRYLRISYSGGHIFICYSLPQVTSNPGVAADEVSTGLLSIIDILALDIVLILAK